MAARWFYTSGGNEFGPVPGVVLRRLVDAGKLLPTDLVMKEGTAQWWPASSVKGLFPTLQTQPQDAARREEAGEGQLELSGLARFLLGSRWGLAKMCCFIMTITLSMILIMEIQEPNIKPINWARYGIAWMIFSLMFLVPATVTWLVCRWDAGKKTTCPRCNARFSKLLLDSKVTVLDSREETRQYTALKAIRDDRLRIVGFVDEERTRTVISRIVQLDRKYRCKTCGHRWETSDIETLVT